MCLNDLCPIRFSCRRFMAKPSEFMQAVQIFQPVFDEETYETNCDTYDEINDHSQPQSQIKYL